MIAATLLFMHEPSLINGRQSLWNVVWGDPESELMILNQSYVLLAVAIVVAPINFLGAYSTVRKTRAKRATQ